MALAQERRNALLEMSLRAPRIAFESNLARIDPIAPAFTGGMQVSVDLAFELGHVTPENFETPRHIPPSCRTANQPLTCGRGAENIIRTSKGGAKDTPLVGSRSEHEAADERLHR